MLTPEQLEIASDIIAPGQGSHGPITYTDLVNMWDDDTIPVPTEAEVTTTWRTHWLNEQTKAISLKSTELIQENVTGDLSEQLTMLMQFSLLLYGIHKGSPTAEADADAMHDAMVPPIIAIQTHEATLKALLNDSTLDSLDVEVGTIDGQATGWPV